MACAHTQDKCTCLPASDSCSQWEGSIRHTCICCSASLPWRLSSDGTCWPCPSLPSLMLGLERSEWAQMSHSPLLRVSGPDPECVPLRTLYSQKEVSGEKLERWRNSWSFEAEIGQWETWGTVDCHLFRQARLLPLCLGHSGGDKGASDGRLPSPQEGGRAGAAGCVCFQMKLCAWGLSGLRPHSCMSVCSACQAPIPGLPASWGQIGALLFFQGVKELYPPL